MRGSRQQRVSKAPPAAQPLDPSGRRDSDASLASSRPSSAGGRPPSALLTDRSAQSAALRSINSYLSSHSAPFSLKPPLPSARDITDALRFLLSRLDFPLDHLEDDLLALLKTLGCPIKLNRSALKAPGTPHSWPALLSVLYWLVQLARYSDHSSSSSSSPSSNDLLLFVANSYSLFISGDDDAVADLDEEYLQKAQHQAANAEAVVDALVKEEEDLQARVRALTSGPSRREALEKEREVLMEDVKKFEAVVESWGGKVAATEGALRDWEKELEAKEKESGRLCEESEELKRRIEGQAVNVRDAERMKRELQAVERDIADAENGRNSMEEKAWELEAEAGRRFKEIEVMAEQCNQAVRKLKLSNDYQYVLNAKGSSPAEVMGLDYKNTLKPALAALSDDTKKLSVSKLEELIALQQQSRENATMLEEKRGCLADLQAKVDEAETRLNLLKEEMEEHASKCTTEAEKVREEFTRKEQQLGTVEKEAEVFLKSSEQKLQDAFRETDEETQMCAQELLALIDVVSQYKEYMESTASGLKKEVTDIANSVAEAYKASAVSAKTVSTGLNPSLKRARDPSPNT